MLVKVAKDFRWEMGHRLMSHPGLCRNLHGHSYRVSVEFEGTLDDQGMVVDYGEIKTWVEPIVQQLDHAMMLQATDPFADYLCDQGQKVVILNEPPTAENIAIYFGDRLKSVFSEKPNIVRLTVTIYETATATAQVTIQK